MTSIALQGLTKRFGRTTAVEAVDLEIRTGELFFLLGPSGCGKTTLLRAIAGFVTPTSGRIAFDGRDVTALAPNRRGTGMVFQGYALWPHMSVFDNVAYGLRVRRIASRERTARVEEALRLVRMSGYGERKPAALSGGQQQRVALARALVIAPSVLLLDEPLSNLDAKLRLEMRSEIQRVRAGTGITTVYVTHDQKEALSMADRVAVLHAGRVMQVGTPRALYERPTSRFVAEFLGETNLIPAVVVEVTRGVAVLDTPGGRLRSAVGKDGPPVGRAVTLSARPECLRLVGPGVTGNVLSGTRTGTVYLGEMAQHVVRLADGSKIKAAELNPGPLDPPGNTVTLEIDETQAIILSE